MEALLPALALLACPVGMGLMMFFMARGSRSRTTEPTHSAERPDPPSDAPMSLEVLREEHMRLGEEIDRLEAPTPSGQQPADQR